jgi:hypothetical protein
VAASASARRALTISRPALAVGGLVLVAAGVRAWLGGRITTPWIMVDELIYSELAKNVAAGGVLRIREHATALYSLLYPFFIAPGWWASSLDVTYAFARAVNAVLMASAAIPLYVLARRVVSTTGALTAAALTLLMPAFVYTGSLMTENAFLPAFVLAALAICCTLERPTQTRQALAVLSIALACAIRLEGLVLVAVYATAVGLGLLLDRRSGARTPVKPYWFSAAALGITGLLTLVLSLALHRSVVGSLGAYQAATEARYTVADSARWTLYHLSELGLAAVFAPLSALVGLAVLAWRGRLSAAERALVAVTSSAVPWIVVFAGVFASRNSLRVQERYVFYVIPLLLVALVLWLERGRPRTILALVAGVVPLALLAALPFRDVVNGSTLADAFALQPLYWLLQHATFGIRGVRELAFGVAAFSAAAFAFAPLRVARILLPTLVAAVFLATQVAVSAIVGDYARSLRDSTVGARPAWLDDRLGKDASVGFVWTGLLDPSFLWQTELWNRSLRTVYRLAPEPGNLPAAATSVAGAGRLVAPPGFPAPQALATDWTMTLNEKPLETLPNGVSLYPVRPTTRVVDRRRGLYADSWIGRQLRYTRFRCGRRAWLGFALANDPTLRQGPVTAVARQYGHGVARIVVPPGTERFLRVPAEGRGGSCRVTIDISPTAVPVNVIPGSTDTRVLGLKLYTATYGPR